MKKLTIFTLFLVLSTSIFAQQKKNLQFDDILKWNRITEKMISNDGKFVVYKNEPWKGDPILKITTPTGAEQASIIGGTNAVITKGSKFAIFTIKPELELVRDLKLLKTKKDKLPKNSLGIYNLNTNELVKVEKLISHKAPTKWGGWLAYQFEKPKTKPAPKGEKADKTKKKEKAESKKNGYALNIKNLNNGEIISFPFVTSYVFAEEGHALTFISTGDDKDFEAGVYVFNADENSNKAIFTGKAEYKQLSIKKDAGSIAFLANFVKDKKAPKKYSLHLWNGEGMAKLVVDNSNTAIPEDWEISANGRLSFADKTDRVFFGTAPIRPVKDTTVLEEEIPVLDIWLWDEPMLHTQQLNQKSRLLRKTYMAVYHADQDKMVQLENKDYSRMGLIAKGDADVVLAYSNVPYAVQTMWEGSPAHADFYLVDVLTGNAKMIKKDVRATPSVSPTGKYLYWYNAMDTSWNTYTLASGKEYKLTSPNSVQCANELNDIPNPPRAYGSPGWLKDDEAFLVYDRFDIWALDPNNKEKPLNLTINGRELSTSYRLVELDKTPRGRFGGAPGEGIDIKKTAFLTGHNEITREDSYLSTSLKKAAKPKMIIGGKYRLARPIKAKDADLIVYTKEDFKTYPNLLATTLKFKKSTQISDAAPQQKDFYWGDVELVNWTSLDGRKLQGTLHMPENFDPNKKYPMIVNFYEKYSQGLYGYRMPEAHRSTIDYHYYTSNGYIIFNPDIYYKTGYPGEDAFNCVMPGVTALIARGFVEEDHIAAQGHSWGGYQVAYLATRTNMFAAIESGAPVVNMFSAYGGIRWGSGMNRSFQYEHTQSRIGKSIWESPLRYIENSPLFTMDKVQTPILIMHNDNDGAVPWYQGIEYFIALRRLQKPAWLLNYNQADHWPLKVRDKYDFQIRMAQFFDHYLKGKPMPVWMKEGVPAIDKGFKMGYELVK